MAYTEPPTVTDATALTPALWNTYIRDNFRQVSKLASFKPFRYTSWIAAGSGGTFQLPFVDYLWDWKEGDNPAVLGLGWTDDVPYITLPLTGLYSVSFSFTATANTANCYAFAAAAQHCKPAAWSPSYEVISNIVTAQAHPRTNGLTGANIGFSEKVRLSASGTFRAYATECVAIRIATQQLGTVSWTFGTDTLAGAPVYCAVTYVGAG